MEVLTEIEGVATDKNDKPMVRFQMFWSTGICATFAGGYRYNWYYCVRRPLRGGGSEGQCGQDPLIVFTSDLTLAGRREQIAQGI